MARRRSRNPILIEALERRTLLAAPIVPIGQQPTGPLTGKLVFVSGGHGLTSDYPNATTWRTQRGEGNEMVEDWGNQDQLASYVNYLWNAGATVIPLRPVGYQPNEVVIDNTSASVTWTGSWANSTGSPYYGSASDSVHYRFANVSATETAKARYTPNIPQAGFYPVYAWALFGSNRTSQTYRVNHSGGATEVKVDHRRVGKGWVYLGTYHFNAGTAGNVEISNKASGGSVVIADAIRFGNGMGDVTRNGAGSGRSREDEAALYWIIRSAGVGVGESVYGPDAADHSDTPDAPIRFAAHMNRESEGAATDRVYLGFHSNASAGGTARGVLGLVNSSTGDTPNQYRWAELLGLEVNNDMDALDPLLEYPWFSRSSVIYAPGGNYLEINGTFIDKNDTDDSARGTPEMDATILEVAFHDNVEDAALMRDPKFRDWVGRSSYQATVRYFNEFAGAALAFAPAAPTNLRAVVQSNGNVTLSWTAPAATSYGGDAPTGYRIYTSTNGYGFDGGTVVGNVSGYTFPASAIPGEAVYFRVVATNAGGESPPTPVVVARKGPLVKSRVLIVNGFDRLDRGQNFRQTTTVVSGGSSVTIDRVRPRFSNSFDYVVQYAEAIEAMGYFMGIDSADNSAVLAGQINLADYHSVLWISGEESSADDTFNATEQSLIAAYLSGGGKLMVSGSEIGWDLAAQNNGATFYANSLRASYVADDAGTYSATGAGIFAGISLSFDNGSQFYDVEFPDKIAAANGSTLAMSYTGNGSGGAAVQYSSGNTRLVHLAFPFETITNEANRNAVMAATLNYFGTPALNVTSGTTIVTGFGKFSTVSVSGGATLRLASGASSLLRTGALSLAGGATLDLTDGKLIVDAPAASKNAVLTQMSAWIAAARAGGAWTGAGLTSSTAAANAQRTTGVGIMLNDSGSGAAILGQFGGQTVTADSILVRYSYVGDADLDGAVDADDFFLIDAGYLAAATTYRRGNFNYDARIDIDDFFLIDRAFVLQGGPLSLDNPDNWLETPATNYPLPTSN